jgi:hypothetical protein
MRFILKKDIVIKAGTVLESAPYSMSIDATQVSEHTFPLGRDFSGRVLLNTGDARDWGNPKTRRTLSRWFKRENP